MTAHLDAGLAFAASTAKSSRATANISQPGVLAMVLIYDLIVISLTGAMLSSAGLAFSVTTVALAIALVMAITTLGLAKNWFYTISALTRLTRQIAGTGLWLFLALAALVVVSLLLAGDMNAVRSWIAVWFLSGWVQLAAGRVAICWWIERQARRGALVRKTVIVGGGEIAETLIRRLQENSTQDIRILGTFDDRDAGRSPDNAEGYTKLGSFEDLASFCHEKNVDLIIIAIPHTAEDRILSLLQSLWHLPIDIRISAHGAKLKLRDRAYSYIGDIPFLPVFDKPMSDWAHAVKIIEDRVIAAAALVVLSPLLALTALAVRLTSSGPILFRQERYGFNNEPIQVLKFRTMYSDQCDSRATKLVSKNDPRVTPVGRFLRKTSIDELPQLLNVLRGELSLVGPRPHALQAKAGGEQYDKVVNGYFARHRMKPGITGWAQINGWRGETDTAEKIEQRVRFDMYYIDNWSLLFDLQILVRTPLSLLNTKAAY